MQTQISPTQSPLDGIAPSATSAGPSVDSEITWLLHRAAQRLRGATGEQAEKHGIQLRDYIVLSALDMTPDSPKSNWEGRSGWIRPRSWPVGPA